MENRTGLVTEVINVPAGYTAEEWKWQIRCSEVLDWTRDVTPPDNLDKAIFVLPPKVEASPPQVKIPPKKEVEWSYNGQVVYFIGGAEGPIKIGRTVNIKNRLKAIQNGSSVRLSVLATTPGASGEEWIYHQRFAAHRLQGEWFARHPDILSVIDRLNSSPSPAVGVG